MICDLAETYHIYDWRTVPLTTVSVLVFGLRADSRLKMRISGLPADFMFGEILQAKIADALSILLWSKTKDGQHNRNHPASIVNIILGKKDETKNEVFDTPEDFERARARLLDKR